MNDEEVPWEGVKPGVIPDPRGVGNPGMRYSPRDCAAPRPTSQCRRLGPFASIAGWLAQFYDPTNEVPYFTILGFIAIGLGVALLFAVKPVLALMKGVR